MMKASLVFFLLLIAGFSCAIDVEFYYGQGCPHCERTSATLLALSGGYNLSIQGKEVYSVPQNRQEMLGLYARFGLDPLDSAHTGVPTTLVGNRSLVVGEISAARWQEIFGYCTAGSCRAGVFTENSFSPVEERDEASRLTLPVLVGAAVVDSINPCTIAVMVMLLGVILLSQGRRQALAAGIAFSLTIFAMYLMMGLGIFRMLAAYQLQGAFFIFVTIAALALAILEIRAYFSYRPGLLAVEMPIFLRPYAKRAMAGAVSLPGVVFAAVACSLFLLPCSSGPYLMVLAMLSKSFSAEALSYLLLYNFIFILPMLVITAFIYLGKTNAEKVNGLKERYIREIHLLSGLILFALFLLMLGQATGWY
jgi:cytochrome c biogenesis protein CcdA